MTNLCVAELAALQTFPSFYRFPPCSTLAKRQIGNAVPPLVAWLLLADEAPGPRDADEPLSPSLFS